MYNGHKRAHLVKMARDNAAKWDHADAIRTGQRSSHHDAFMMDASGVIPAMRRACRRAGRVYQLYDDPAYPLSPWMGAPFASLGLIIGEEAK